MTTPVTGPGYAPLPAMRVLAVALMSALVVIGIALSLLPEIERTSYPPTWAAWAIGGLAVFAHVVCQAVGYRAKPVALTTAPQEAANLAVMQFRSLMTVRFAVTESVAIISLALCFVLEPSTVMTYLIGATLALLLMALHVWPHERVIGKVERSLEREGGRSYLRQGLAGQPV